jgi:hypothetical protein
MGLVVQLYKYIDQSRKHRSETHGNVLYTIHGYPNELSGEKVCKAVKHPLRLATVGKDWPSYIFSADSVCSQPLKAGKRGYIGRRVSPCGFETLCVHCSPIESVHRPATPIIMEVKDDRLVLLPCSLWVMVQG